MNKKVLLRMAGVMAGVILLTNCVGCSNEQREKGNASNGIEVETIDVETIEVEEIIVK